MANTEQVGTSATSCAGVDDAEDIISDGTGFVVEADASVVVESLVVVASTSSAKPMKNRDAASNANVRVCRSIEVGASDEGAAGGGAIGESEAGAGACVGISVGVVTCGIGNVAGAD